MKHEAYMQRCIELAQNGAGNVSPNPMVGAVVVYNDEIIGEGYHQLYGEAHAEVNAIKAVKDKSLLSKATIYVSLEPCAHFGKTPPCSDLIIDSRIPNVVIGCTDPFAQVSGKGIEKLKNAGTTVSVGILKKECLELNKRFFTFHEKKRPYIILKWAQSKDGFMDKKRTDTCPTINWITEPNTKQLTHKWRSEEDAILIGKNTAINDNPELTTRVVDGKNPIRIVVDRKLKLPKDLKIFNSEAKTIILNELKNEENDSILYKKVNFESFFDDLWSICIENDIISLIVEGGAFTINQFIENDLWDEARVLTGKPFFVGGIKAPKLNIERNQQLSFGKDEISYYIK
jgi:diaminohydroxyphosphoribosylaminopyrimidine deaminase / 5-amino-6-(5-phosphoribosylamino)uracil reductase